MNSILTKPIEEISFDDVVEFCQQGIKEGGILDYKQKFPKELEKSICAFANSYGGIIIIGVRTDDGKPVPPYEGVPYRKGLEETVWQIITTKIWPPIFPQIRVCPPKNGRTFIVIRVPQSEVTPHAVLNKWVYVRVGNMTDIATTEKIEWLRNRREKSEQFRKMLCRRADDRFTNIFKDYLSDLLDFKISSIPLYPQRPFVKVEKIEEIADTHHTKDGISIKFRYQPDSTYPKNFPGEKSLGNVLTWLFLDCRSILILTFRIGKLNIGESKTV